MDIFTAENLMALLTLIVLEIVLGIDNVIFIALLSGKLPENQQDRARKFGIGLAVVSRIALLLGISAIVRLTTPLFTVASHSFSGRDLILLAGGLFLIAKSTYEIHDKLEAAESVDGGKRAAMATMAAVLIQIVIIDLIFSLDSVITAVGISGVLWVMITAIVLAAAVMLIFSGAIARFVEQHPTMKVLALAFLILIGVLLTMEGWDHKAVESLQLKNYAYFAMTFSFIVELVNMRLRQSVKPVKLHNVPNLPAKEEA